MKDKRGGVPRAHNLMQMLRHVLDHCGFVDLGYLVQILLGMVIEEVS